MQVEAQRHVDAGQIAFAQQRQARWRAAQLGKLAVGSGLHAAALGAHDLQVGGDGLGVGRGVAARQVLGTRTAQRKGIHPVRHVTISHYIFGPKAAAPVRVTPQINGAATVCQIQPAKVVRVGILARLVASSTGDDHCAAIGADQLSQGRAVQVAVQDKIAIVEQHGGAVVLVELAQPVKGVVQQRDLEVGALCPLQGRPCLALANEQAVGLVLVRGAQPGRVQAQQGDPLPGQVQCADVEVAFVVKGRVAAQVIIDKSGVALETSEH